jgi:flagellar assembly protein FliH
MSASATEVKGTASVEHVERFELPIVEGEIATKLGGGTSTGMLTARQLEELHQQAYQDGYDTGQSAGYADGEKLAKDMLDKRADVLDGIIATLTQPLAALDIELVESVAELALLIARHMVRRELKSAPGEVVGVVRETLKHLPIASRGTRIRLNPEDVDIVRSALSLGDDPTSWRLEPDPLVARGGCIVDTETSRIDATVETRLAAIASKMFGGERESDRNA